jgi:flagellar hook-length control protein FliK
MDGSSVTTSAVNTPASGALLDGDRVLGAALAAGLLHGSSGKNALADLNQATALLAPPANPVHASPPLLQLQLPSPAGSSAFAQELGQQVAWLGGQDVKQASIRLHPAELGQLEVKISVSHGRVDVVFNAQHPAAVTAVQQTLPHLDQMLAQHGLSLGNAEVGQQGRGDQREARSGGGPAFVAGGADDGPAIGQPESTGSISLIDAFA